MRPLSAPGISSVLSMPKAKSRQRRIMRPPSGKETKSSAIALPPSVPETLSAQWKAESSRAWRIMRQPSGMRIRRPPREPLRWVHRPSRLDRALWPSGRRTKPMAQIPQRWGKITFPAKKIRRACKIPLPSVHPIQQTETRVRRTATRTMRMVKMRRLSVKEIFPAPMGMRPLQIPAPSASTIKH